ncbi:MAG: phosphoribosylamine--glycine ligase [archaeon]|nr:phosphoribosylamine--glycine ligase [archaeon]
MKILTIGGGAREHAAIEALARCDVEIYAVMKNTNPGIKARAKKILNCGESDVDTICDFAIENQIEYAFVGPEAPLSAGVVDALENIGIKCASPTQAAARIETSKTFMRNLVQNHNIEGNLGFKSCETADEAIEYVKNAPYDFAVKPVGLTGGKGVKVMGDQLKTIDDAIDYINEIFDGNVGGGKVIIEEKAVGEEFTQMVFTNGSEIIPMPLVQDHKRAYEGDEGPNTGGMGSYSDADHLLPFVTEEDRAKALSIVESIVKALAEEGCPYRGTMYGQFMLTKDGPKIIEINARFGDPEAMNVLTLITSDFSEVIKWMSGGKIKNDVTFANKATVCKYIVPTGYGVRSESGHTITVDIDGIKNAGAIAYYGSIDEKEDGTLVTGTSRSIGVVGAGDTLEDAERNCEAALGYIKCDAIYIRHDIGTAALIQKRVDHMKQLRGQ